MEWMASEFAQIHQFPVRHVFSPSHTFPSVDCRSTWTRADMRMEKISRQGLAVACDRLARHAIAWLRGFRPPHLTG
jgi:hypothetical protein